MTMRELVDLAKTLEGKRVVESRLEFSGRELTLTFQDGTLLKISEETLGSDLGGHFYWTQAELKTAGGKFVDLINTLSAQKH